METQTSHPLINGVNVAALIGAREALEAAPAAAEFTWKASAEWVDGVHTRTQVGGFYGLGVTSPAARPLSSIPITRGIRGPDQAPTSVEIVLSGWPGA